MPGRGLPPLLLSFSCAVAGVLPASPALADDPAVAAPSSGVPAPGASPGCRWRSGGKRCQDPLVMAVGYAVMSSGWAALTAVIAYYGDRATGARGGYILCGSLTGLLAAGEAGVAGWMFYDRFHPLGATVARPLLTISPAGASLGVAGSF